MNSGTWQMRPCRRCGKDVELNIALPEVREEIRAKNVLHPICSIFEQLNENLQAKEEENV